MNDEIKEMTKVLKSLGNKQASELYNYITNLQQDLYYYQNYGADMLHKNNNLEDRIEKAVEYIEHSKFIKEQVIMKSNYDMQDFQVKELLNILNGRSDE